MLENENLGSCLENCFLTFSPRGPGMPRSPLRPCKEERPTSVLALGTSCMEIGGNKNGKEYKKPTYWLLQKFLIKIAWFTLKQTMKIIYQYTNDHLNGLNLAFLERIQNPPFYLTEFSYLPDIHRI